MRHLCSIGVQGFYTLYAKDMISGRVRQLAAFENLILDAALERLGTTDMDPAYCHVGSGTTTPANVQTSLTTFIASAARSASSSVAYVAGPPPYCRRVYTYTFNAGAVVGNVSEVGVGWGTSGATLGSRALILDSFGVPTTITVLASEALFVTYELKIYPPTADYVGVHLIGGVSTTVTLRAAQISDTSLWSPALFQSGFQNPSASTLTGTIGSITSAPSGSGIPSGTASYQSYSATSRRRGMQISYGTSQGNDAGGIGAIQFSGSGFSFQAGFSPKIAKTNTQSLALVFEATWARAA